MQRINKKILEQLIASTSEPVLLVRIDQPDWPVVLANPAFATIGSDEVLRQPFADVIEQLAGRELALEVSETVRSQQETNFSVELKKRDYLLVVKPLFLPTEESARFYAAYWRRGVGSGPAESAEVHQALLKAKRRIRDLSRDDPVTGLLNQRAFREIFEHDWAVAKREQSALSVVTFTLNDFDAYVDVFGRHAADSCLRRAGRAIRSQPASCQRCDRTDGRRTFHRVIARDGRAGRAAIRRFDRDVGSRARSASSALAVGEVRYRIANGRRCGHGQRDAQRTRVS